MNTHETTWVYACCTCTTLWMFSSACMYVCACEDTLNIVHSSFFTKPQNIIAINKFYDNHHWALTAITEGNNIKFNVVVNFFTNY